MKKNLRHYFPLILIILCLPLLIWTVRLQLSNIELQQRINIQSDRINEKDKQSNESIKNLKADLSACLNGNANLTELTSLPYDFSYVGIYSPLLINSIVETANYKYKGANLIGQTITPSVPYDSFYWKLDVWSLTKSNGNLTFNPFLREPETPSRAVLSYDFPVFGGYENYTNQPRYWISDRLIYWNKHPEVKRVTKTGIIMYLIHDYGAKNLDSSSYLESYQENLLGSYPGYFTLTVFPRGYGTDTKPVINTVELEKVLLQIANTFSFDLSK